MNPDVASTEQDAVLAAFVRALGDDAHEKWASACAAVALDSPGSAAPSERLVAVLRVLAADEGLTRVIALGQLVRVRTAMTRGAAVLA